MIEIIETRFFAPIEMRFVASMIVAEMQMKVP